MDTKDTEARAGNLIKCDEDLSGLLAVTYGWLCHILHLAAAVFRVGPFHM